MAEAVSYLMEAILFVVTLVCTLVIAMNLLAIELIDAITTETMNAVLNTFFELLFMFMFCSLSEYMTSDLLEIDDIFYNSAWYRLPVKKQRLVVQPIERAQRVFRLKGLGLFDCSLAVFATVKLLFFCLFSGFSLN